VARSAEPGLSDDQVPEVWRALGLPGLADIHVHFLPPAMLAKVWRYFDQARAHYGIEWPVHYRGDDDERVGRLTSLGVHRFPTLAYPHRPGMAAWLNEWTAEFACQHEQALLSATFYPEPGAREYVAAAIERGTRVFKAHVQVGDYDPADPLLDPVWGQLADAGAPVVVHCGSGPLPGTHTGPGPMGQVLRRHPTLTAVIAHAGAPEYAEHLDLVLRYPNTHLDTTMVGTPFMNRLAPLPAEVRARYADAGARIVLGSDFPNIPHSYATQIQSLLDFDCGDDWLRRVLWHNGAALLKLESG
jgi:predicted TIM-barrel fold metal-dependent hydrolase